jgi:small subunit ribosomal protein S1
MPGSAVDVADWSEIQEGEVVEAVITGSNTGGLECKVGNIRGFIPASQIAPYRVENMGEFVGQKALCVISEANERRGNLILSRRAVLERERVEQRAERLASIEVGAAVKGTVRKIMDFGAFVDIGGLDGLLHISQLSYERVKHPSEILQEGQQIDVRIDKIDPQSGKIGLSYRSLQEHPWANIQSRFAVGSLVKGTVTRIAEFGAFVRLATGVEGLVHLSELAHYRVQRVSSVVSEGQEVEVKVLSIEEEKQRISLSLKAAQAPPPSAETEEEAAATEAVAEPPRKSVRKQDGPLRGGTGGSAGGDRFGLKW